MNRIIAFFSKPIFSDKRFLFCLWVLIGIVAGAKGSHISNNFLIFKGVFNHAIQQLNLYAPYPDEYWDVNHYGPVFSLLIAPFTFLPERLGVILWNVLISLSLFTAIHYLPIPSKRKIWLYYIPLNELFISAAYAQTNALITALVIGSLICIRKEKDFWAACFIALGTFIKIYGIVGLSFFFFSKNKGRFLAYLGIWSIVFFLLPMLVSFPEYIVQTYIDWYNDLVYKNIANMTSFAQDISVIGLFRRLSGDLEASALFVLIPAVILFALQYVDTKKYQLLPYQIGILASALFAIVLFSTGSESPTYIIAIVAIALWFCIQERPYRKWVIALLLFAILWTTLLPSGMFPDSFRKGIVLRYSLKAVGSLAVWLVLVYQLAVPGRINKNMLDTKIEKNG